MSPAFEHKLRHAGAEEYVSGIVLLETAIDIFALDQALHSKRATPAERYGEVYAALRYNAEQAQPRFRGELDAGVGSGLVRGYQAYWIENLFVVSAKATFFEALRKRGDIRSLSENFRAKLIAPERGDATNGRDHVPRESGYDGLDEESTEPGQDAIGATR
ncbi:MAG: hypothetical protein IPG71_13420 [bacterium]|nr:hypothetical protein [bacterium]